MTNQDEDAAFTGEGFKAQGYTEGVKEFTNKKERNNTGEIIEIEREEKEWLDGQNLLQSWSVCYA